MTDETTQTGGLTTPPTPGTSGTAPIPEPPNTGESQDSNEGEELFSGPPFEEWFSQREAEPYKEEYQRHMSERDKETKKEAYRNLQRSIQPSIDRWTSNSQATREGITRIASSIEKAVKNGNLDNEELNDLFQNNKELLNAINGGNWWEGSYYILGELAKATDDDQLAKEFFGRMYNNAVSNTDDPKFIPDFIERLTDSAISSKIKEAEEKAYQKGLKEGKRVAGENSNAQSRAGSGPDPNSKKAAGGGTRYTKEQFKKMTPQEILQIPREERDRVLTS